MLVIRRERKRPNRREPMWFGNVTGVVLLGKIMVPWKRGFSLPLMDATCQWVGRTPFDQTVSTCNRSTRRLACTHDMIVMPTVSKNHKYKTSFIFYNPRTSGGKGENPVFRASVNVPETFVSRIMSRRMSRGITYWRRIEVKNVAFFGAMEDQTLESHMRIGV